MKLWDGSWDTCTCGEGGDGQVGSIGMLAITEMMEIVLMRK